MSEEKSVSHFIKNAIESDLATGKHQTIVTRFPPEPNGYLHIGHAKSICLNFSLAQEYPGAKCHLRFDDTNPEKENTEYVESIKKDVQWLGFQWDNLFYASDYFDKLYGYAEELIMAGKAYVCGLVGDEIRAHRGTLTEAGKNSPYRDRPIEENIKLFAAMKKGEYQEGELSLRVKIDMASGNINMRDPIIYRIRKKDHYRTGSTWCVYPMYDFTHVLSDSIEGITHSLCTLEFEDHRPLYEWFLKELECSVKPQQIEFARLELNYTVTSKRKLKELVEEKFVEGWDDPRLPTLSGLRRRGFSPTSIRGFCQRIGVSKKKSVIDMSMLEECARDSLNIEADRAMCVLKPLKVVITNFEGKNLENLTAPNHPQIEGRGVRQITFSREIFIDCDDFMEKPPKKFHRLCPGKEVRLRNGYVICCDEVVKDESGEIIELRCTYDRDTLGSPPADGRKVKGVIHWVNGQDAVEAEVRLYDRLFTVPNPSQGTQDYKEHINPHSLVVLKGAKLERGLAKCAPGATYQFERVGYFCRDSEAAGLVFNRVTTLKDTWAKIVKK